ncbi:SMP-30/gluconolactonase/LRE family protein [Dactylosporangium sp. CS-047395]|uniref:YVTN family beta-propeller repeat protein n=1 Tax=Dactylosporangium sp. CS-047395 TaxID=3239936 RepID=UPI003D93C018
MRKSLLGLLTAAAVGATTAIAMVSSPAAAASTTRQVVYVVGSDDTLIGMFDPNTLQYVTLGVLDAKPTAMVAAPDGGRLYMSSRSGASMAVFDTATSTVVATVPIGAGAAGIVVTPDGRRVYVADGATNQVKVVDTATNAVTASVRVGSAPDGLAVSADGRRVFVADSGSNDLSVIDTATNTVAATVAVGSAPHAVAVTPDGRRAYVLNSASTGSVSVVDTATNAVTATVPVGGRPFGIAIAPDGAHAYVTNTADNTVSVIATATNTAGPAIPVGPSPQAIGVAPDGKHVAVFNGGELSTGSLIDVTTNRVTVNAEGLVWNPAALAFATVQPAPPTAGFTLTSSSDYGSVHVDPKDSKHGFAWIDHHTVDWGDGSPVGTLASNGSHTYKSAGTYTITVTAVDEIGETNSATKQVSVYPRTKTFGLLSRSNLRYVATDAAGTGPLVANRAAIDYPDAFDQLDLGNGEIALRSRITQRYFAIDATNRLVASGATVADAAHFRIVQGTDGAFSLLAVATNRYVSGNDGTGPLTADRTEIGPWEQFYATFMLNRLRPQRT